MEMILLDWTRMGKTYCLAGAVLDDLELHIVRPLQWHLRAPERKTGWSPYLLDGHTRWEVFELEGVRPAPPEPPHLEDVWVRSLRPLNKLATAEQRRTILAATAAAATGPVFGAPLTATRACAYLSPGCGERSLATLVVPARAVRFGTAWREGSDTPDFRVKLPLAEFGERLLAVKDHHLLSRAERAGADLDAQIAALQGAVSAMGTHVAVRLGLSRPYLAADDRGPALCWLMADGFFSPTDPQP